MSDTPVDIEARFHKMILSLAPAQRLIMACRMFSTAQTLVRAGILQEGKQLDAEALRERLFKRLYGQDFRTSASEKILRYLKAT